MPDILAIVSKAQFEADFASAKPGDVLPIDRYTSANKALQPAANGGSIFLATVRPPDEKLWLVGVLEAPDFDGKMWRAPANQAPVTDLGGVRDRLRFSTGKGIQAKPGALGMSLQTPRQLTAEDALLLRQSLGGKPRATKAVASAATKTVAGANALATAATALEAGDRAAALTALAAVWRECRAPELEALIDAVGAEAARGLPEIAGERNAFDEAWNARERQHRVVDLHPLLTTLTKEPRGSIPLRLRALLDWDRDSRLGAALLSMIEAPPLTASSNFSMWSTLFKALPDFADTRAKKRLQARAKKHDGDSQFWPKLTAWIEAVLSKLPEPASLSPADQKRVAAMHQRVARLAKGSASVATESVAAPNDSRAPSERLEAALAALKKQDLAKALDELLSVWRDKRAPEIATLAEQLGHLVAAKQSPIADGKPADVHAQWMELGRRVNSADVTRLLNALRLGKLVDVDERLAQMLHWPPDPRVTPRVLALISDKLIGARPTFRRAVYDLFVAHADPRTRAVILADNQRLETPNFDFDVIAMRRSHARRTEAALRAATDVEVTLSKLEQAAIAGLQGALAQATRAAATARDAAQVNDVALVGEIAARFDDDAPRLVYADLLSERGDARGPYITMAIADARGGKLKGKLAAYEKQHRNELVGPLKPALEKFAFARGFLDAASLQDRGVPWNDAAVIDALVNDLRWATVRVLAVRSIHNHKVDAILERAPLHSLRQLQEIQLSSLGKLLAREVVLPLERIEDLLLDRDARQKTQPIAPPLADVLARAHHKVPQLRSVDFFNFDVPPLELMRAPFMQRLERVTAGSPNFGGTLDLAGWLTALHQLGVAQAEIITAPTRLTLDAGTLTLDVSRSVYDDGTWNESRAEYLAALAQVPAKLFPSLRVKFGAHVAKDRADILAAMKHANPQAA